jgi:hypothetical protein
VVGLGTLEALDVDLGAHEAIFAASGGVLVIPSG